MPEIQPAYRAETQVYRYEATVDGRLAQVLIPYPTGQRLARRERDALARAAFAKLARSAG